MAITQEKLVEIIQEANNIKIYADNKLSLRIGCGIDLPKDTINTSLGNAQVVSLLPYSSTKTYSRYRNEFGFWVKF